MIKPRLRTLEFQPVTYQDQQMWLVRDPLELSDYQLILTPAMAQLAVFCDGSRDIDEIQSAFSEYFNTPVESTVVDRMIKELDEAYLFANDRSLEVQEQQLDLYRSQPYRSPALAGISYPEDGDELQEVLEAFGEGDHLEGWRPWSGRAIISPHIDFLRGGRIYSKVWRRARAAVQAADLVLIFGTDHNGGPGRINLTLQPYATPWGVIPTDNGLINKLAESLGSDAFDQELHHRSEHSVELSAIWYHFIRGQNPSPMVPILCGSFQGYIENGHSPGDDRRLNAFIETLKAETAGKKVLAVASVDLAHVGPQFGDDFIMDESRRVFLRESDRELMEAINQGDADHFYYQIAAVQDKNRICGFSSIYLMLRYLGPLTGRQIAYQLCPADEEDHSLVSIAGMLLN